MEPGRDDGLAAALEELLHQDVLHQIQQDPEVQYRVWDHLHFLIGQFLPVKKKTIFTYLDRETPGNKTKYMAIW